MLLRKLTILLALCSAGPLLASTHTWLGTSSDRISDPTNWSGGSPAGDAEAKLVFPSSAERFLVTNDVPGLAFKTLNFEDQRYVLAGQPIQAVNATTLGYDGKIACPLQIEGTFTVYGGGGFIGLELAGPISGNGGIFFGNGTITMTGAASNTYTGVTVVSTARLQLNKSGGAIAIPGEVRGERAGYPSRMIIQAPEQIADTATVRWPTDSGDIQFEADETVGTLEVGTVYLFDFVPVPTLTVSNLVLTGRTDCRLNLRLKQSVLDVPQGTQIYFSSGDGRVTVPAEGITLRGPGTVQWRGAYTSPTRIEGTEAYLRVPNSDVLMTGGSFGGEARSIVAEGGTLYGRSQSFGGIRLVAAARLELDSYPLRLNGLLDLGGASIMTQIYAFDRTSHVIIENESAEPVLGTFAGIAENGTVENRFRLSYHGGSGNDVTLADLQKPFASVALTQLTQPGYVDEPVTVEVTVSGAEGVPTGSISIHAGWPGPVLATVPLIAGKTTYARTTDSLSRNSLYARYGGDATYARSDDVGLGLELTYRTPVLTSIDPPSGQTGTPVPVTLRGSNFHPRARISGPVSESIVFVSSTELRATFDLSQYVDAVTLNIAVGAPEGSVYSDAIPFAVEAQAEPPSSLTFDQNGAIAQVTPGAKTAWETTRENQSVNLITDEDGDGIVRWNWTPSSPPFALWSVVDLSSGQFAVRGSRDAKAKVLPFPAYTFIRDGQGNASQFVLPLGETPYRIWRMLWARPGVGAWIYTLTDGSDDDKLDNDILIGSVGPMAPMGGPPHPAGFAPGDIVIFMPRGPLGSLETLVFAARLGQEIEAQSPGVLQAALNGLSYSEGAGVTKLPVLRTNGADGTVSVRYSTVERSARSGVHFTGTTGTLTFAPGETIRWIEIPLLDDALYRGGAVFNVALSEPSGAVLGEETAFIVGITENDPVPVIKLEGPAERHILETDGPQKMTLVLTLTGATTLTATSTWHARDLVQTSGQVTFAPGDTRKNVTFTIPGNDHSDGRRELLIDFGGDWRVEPRFVKIVLHDDETPSISVNDVSVQENAGSAQLTLTMTPAQDQPFYVVYRTSDETAVAPEDYTSGTWSVLFTPGQTELTFEIPIVNDGETEGDESVVVAFEDCCGSPNYVRSSVRTIIIDDEVTTRPTVSIDDGTIVEPENGLASIAFTVRLSAPSSRPVTVFCHTADGSAVSGLDYQSQEQSAVFAPGETETTLTIPVFGDTFRESDETFIATLGSALNATILDGSATATIIDNDEARRRAARK